MAEFTLPELGEDVTTGDVLRVLVKPGDTVAKEQAVLELETDKATIEVPSSVAGRVTAVNVKAGDKVKVGQVVLTVAEGDAAPAVLPSRADGGEAASQEVGGHAALTIPGDGGLAQQVEGAERGNAADQAGMAGGEPERAHAAEMPDTAGTAATGGSARAPDKVVDISRGTRPPVEPVPPPDLPPAPASPSVRRAARELGVDINDVSGSGPDGRISIDDVKAHVRQVVSAAGRAAAAGTRAARPLPDFSRWGEIERQPMGEVRRKSAEHLTAAWTTIPHVTQHDLADVTSLEEARKNYARQVEAAGGNLTITAVAVKVAAAALKVFPQFNASIDLAAGETVYKKYVNIGIAVDTDHGLLVPVVRDADKKNIVQLSVEIAQLSGKARTRTIALEEMQGGCFSVSNLGGIGGTSFTPIVNAPEVAILGISRARMEPVWQPGSGAFVARLLLPLSLSYDHRAIDGAAGARFLRWIVEALEQPFLLALHG